ncbi:secreted protein [Rhodopirellula maiorica SM1]|uniref:Secreted protein n=1 Tax=Rhodopirellula maiorica SM1 TaxID=1265738 RepID=M5RJ43_9BACT|nr:secreted protein [Rhodopirellula maiorica SM1]
MTAQAKAMAAFSFMFMAILALVGTRSLDVYDIIRSLGVVKVGQPSSVYPR